MKAFTAIGKNVLVKLDRREEESEGGIHIPERFREVHIWGEAVSVGESCKACIAGDRVLVPRTQGTQIQVRGHEYAVIVEDAIAAIEAK